MKKIFYGLAAAAYSLVGCTLDRFPETKVTPEQFFKTENDLQLYMNGLYSMSNTSPYWKDVGTDNLHETEAGDLSDLLVNSAAKNAKNFGGDWDWSRLRSLNIFLANASKASVSEAARNHYIGLARYYRAVFYWEKVREYSDVPWYGAPLNPASADLYKAADKRTFVVDKIMEDMEFAAKHVYDKSRVRERGAYHKDYIRLEFARFALEEGTTRKYRTELNLSGTANTFLEKARDMADSIMTSGRFQLATDYGALFFSVKSGHLNSNKEVFIVNDFDGSKRQRTDEVTGMHTRYFPTRDLLYAFLNSDGTRYTDQARYDTNDFVTEFKDRDPRLNATLCYPGWIDEYSDPTKPYVQEFIKDFSGYHMSKWYLQSGDQTVRQGTDIPVGRYAEVLLIYAEAKAELGTITQGDIDKSINLLRKRVNMPNLSLTAANGDVDPYQAAKHTNVTGANKGVILEIRRERRVELALEGTRYEDIRRWGRLEYLETKPTGIYFSKLGKHDLTGDGVPDITILPSTGTLPALTGRGKNALGVTLIYYKQGDKFTLSNGDNGGYIQLFTNETWKLTLPRDYYRPIPYDEVLLNPKLKQPFGWK